MTNKPTWNCPKIAEKDAVGTDPLPKIGRTTIWEVSMDQKVVESRVPQRTLTRKNELRFPNTKVLRSRHIS